MKRAVSFHFANIHKFSPKNDPLRHEAHAYFLAHNTIIVRRSYETTALASALKRLHLQPGFHSARIDHLRVRTPIPEDPDERKVDYDSEGSLGGFADDEWQSIDHRFDANMNWRVISHSLELSEPMPRRLTIVADIYGQRDGEDALPGNRHFGVGLEYVAGLAMKMKEKMEVANNGGDRAGRDPGGCGFRVCAMRKGNGRMRDCTWLWDELTAAEKERLDRFYVDRRKLERLNRRIQALQPLPCWKRGGPRPWQPTPDELVDEYLKVRELVRPFLKDEKAVHKGRVSELAADPGWEARVEFQTAPDFKVYRKAKREEWKNRSREEKDSDGDEEFDSEIEREDDRIVNHLFSILQRDG